MKKKPRFNPEITRVKLNPEQAVLFCDCYDTAKKQKPGELTGGQAGCTGTGRETGSWVKVVGQSISS